MVSLSDECKSTSLDQFSLNFVSEPEQKFKVMTHCAVFIAAQEELNH